MLDLFAHAGAPAPIQRPPVAPMPERYAVPRRAGSIAWERVLSQLGTDDIRFHVSALWTGIVIEVATGRDVGRKGWRKDGEIIEFVQVESAPPGRLVFLRAADALVLHRSHGLALCGRPGSVAALFRFGAGGSAVATLIDGIAAATRSDFL